MQINFKTISHAEHRYPTVGDYWLEGDAWQFRVSDMGNPIYELLVLIHELVEWFLYVIVFKKDPLLIDEFDKQYEAKREEGDLSEPGDDPNAPYYRMHQFATIVERMVAVFAGVDWKAYELAINTLE